MTLTAKRVQSLRMKAQENQFEEVFQDYWPRLVAVLNRILGDPAEAEDLALETFWRLHHNPPAETNLEQVGGWLYRVATNLGLNALRARQRRRRYENEAGQQIWEEQTSPDPADMLERSEQQARVRTILARMRPRAARLLVLRHSGLSYQELARVLRIAPGSVGTLLVRGRTRI